MILKDQNLSTILDVLAYNTYITSYNANMISNEVFIDSATLRENVVALARNIGYVPRSKKSSRADISFFVDISDVSPTPANLTLKAGVSSRHNWENNLAINPSFLVFQRIKQYL